LLYGETAEGHAVSSTTKITRNEYIKTAIAITLVVIIVLGFFFGLRVALNTDTPVRVVESGSMCVPYGSLCDGWSHTFEPTLHVGDIIIIQGVDPKTISANYPNSDIIVYQRPDNPDATPVVHRVVAIYEENGILYFQTKGDGNNEPYPNVPSPAMYDSNSLWHTGKGVPEDMVLGKVVMRIPLFGHITLFLKENPWGLPLVIAVIFVLLIVEFVIPIIRPKGPKPEEKQENETVQKFTLINGQL
jgi:signal peptidase